MKNKHILEHINICFTYIKEYDSTEPYEKHHIQDLVDNINILNALIITYRYNHTDEEAFADIYRTIS